MGKRHGFVGSRVGLHVVELMSLLTPPDVILGS